MTFSASFTEYVKACFTGIWVTTQEPDETQKQIATLATANSWKLYTWDIDQGIHGTSQAQMDPIAPLKITQGECYPGTDTTTILILHNYHKFLSMPNVIQALFNFIIKGKTTRAFAVILSPSLSLPPELEKVFITLDADLPSFDELKAIAASLDDTAEDNDPQAITAAAGLTRCEAEGAFSIALARHGKINPKEVWELKSQMVKKSGLLEMHRGQETFAELGGLHAIKSFATKALAPTNHQAKPKAKGMLLLGVSGSGKSAFAKALGNETGRPTLVLDVASMYGSLVGQTEDRIRRALNVADAMQPCILFVDEIEKALGGAADQHQGDSGVSSRLLGTLLTWLNDHDTDVFFIGTCNDISRLPPEFSRAERFDGIFFVDMPTREEKNAIWTHYRSHYKIDTKGGLNKTPADERWTGAEIKACCRLAALLNVSLQAAAANIMPVAVTNQEKVTALREWATGRCLSASHPGIYHHSPTTLQPTQRRAIQRTEATQ